MPDNLTPRERAGRAVSGWNPMPGHEPLIDRITAAIEAAVADYRTLLAEQAKRADEAEVRNILWEKQTRSAAAAAGVQYVGFSTASAIETQLSDLRAKLLTTETLLAQQAKRADAAVAAEKRQSRRADEAIVAMGEALNQRDAAIAREAALRRALEEWLALANHNKLSTASHRERTRALLAAPSPGLEAKGESK